MASEIDLNGDPFLKLLTDALRAGPGSPEWHQAVAKLRETGADNGQSAKGGKTDEYRMLIAAREHLESGKEYRSVRAGPGFTRKLMHEIEEQSTGGKPRGLPTATLIAIISGLVILLIAGIVVWQVVKRPPVETPKGTVEDLLRIRGELMNETAVARFDAPSSTIPDNWKTIGRLPLDPRKGLHPAAGASVGEPSTSPSAIGGGIVAPGPIAPDEPFVAEAYLHLGNPSENTLVEFFVSTDPNFSPDRATSTNDLVWLLQGTNQKVMLSGREQAKSPRPAPPPGDTAASIPIRVLVNHDSAIVESNGQRLWSGPHELPALPRYVGVRFLRTGPKGPEPAQVVSIRVMKK
jgi:hypothetical protein